MTSALAVYDRFNVDYFFAFWHFLNNKKIMKLIDFFENLVSCFLEKSQPINDLKIFKR